MKQRIRARSSSLFLLELIIAILFFSIASAVCVKIFVKAHTLSEESQVKNWAVSESSGFAEVIRSSDSAGEAHSIISKLYPDSVSKAGAKKGDFAMTTFYDDEFNACSRDKAAYAITIETDTAGSMLTGNIKASDRDMSPPYAFELQVKHCIGANSDKGGDE